MTEHFYKCPICRRAPELAFMPSGVPGAGHWEAYCLCHTVKSERREDLRHLWNDLYCADDPWTVYDEGDDRWRACRTSRMSPSAAP